MLGIGAVVAALLLAPGAEAATPCKPRPRHHTVKTLAANDLVRVYKIVDSWDHAPGFEDTGEVYACDRASGWRRKLGPDGAYPDLIDVHVRLKDRLVAYSTGCSGCREHYRFDGRVALLDMASRHHRFVHRLEGHGYVTDLVLKRGGSVGWIGALDDDAVVRRHDANGPAELDRGDAIEPDSLTLDASSVLHWRSGGEQRSAPLG